MSGLDGFWEEVERILGLLCSAGSAERVIALCQPASSGDGFWPGGDGDDFYGALLTAGWSSVQYEATYLWCAKAPDGSLLTYVEGDLYRGNQMPS